MCITTGSLYLLCKNSTKLELSLGVLASENNLLGKEKQKITFLPEKVIFCVPNTSKVIKHKFWDYIQARCDGSGPLQHDLCGVRTCNYDSFNWKQALFGEEFPRNLLRSQDLEPPLWNYTLDNLD